MVFINNNRDMSKFNIKQVEEKYSAKYVGEFCLKDKSGNWINENVSIFWVEKPARPEYSNYFGLLEMDGVIYITNGLPAVNVDITGIKAEDGEIIYSSYRNHYNVSKDGSVFIDGGRDYIKNSSPEKLVNLRVIDGELMVVYEGSEKLNKMIGY